jgi:glycosyltransferase involved in cell wall biosynthesis
MTEAVLPHATRPSAAAGSDVAGRQDAARPCWLFVDLATNFGGHEVMVLRWIDEFSRSAAVAPVLMCVRGSRLAAMAPATCATMEVPPDIASAQGKWRAALSLLGLVRAMAKVVRQWRPQVVVVAEGCLMAQRHGLLAAALLRQRVLHYVPLVARFSEMGFDDAARLERRVRRFYGRLPDAWLTITPEQAVELRQWSSVKQAIHCLPNTVSVAVEARQGTRMLRPPREGARTKVLVLGRLDAQQKGLDLLLDHLIAHPDLGNQFDIRLVGEGPYAAQLASALQTHSHLNRFVSTAPWSDAIELFASHDALLLPSRYEGVPLVMLEAMALGLPVVASDLPGTRSYLPARCLFPVGDLTRAFDALGRLHRSREDWHDVAEQNVRVFSAQASGAAFSAAVSRLTLLMQQDRA